jgi:hypothetical protein
MIASVDAGFIKQTNKETTDLSTISTSMRMPILDFLVLPKHLLVVWVRAKEAQNPSDG